MSKFKVGDKVVVYLSSGKPYKGTIKLIVDDDRLNIIVHANEGFECSVHPKQCRKLVKKARRRIYLSPESLESGKPCYAYITQTPNLLINELEFVEVKRKHK